MDCLFYKSSYHLCLSFIKPFRRVLNFKEDQIDSYLDDNFTEVDKYTWS